MATIWNSGDKSANITLFRNALSAASGVTATTWKGVRGTTSLSTGKKYLEFYVSGYHNDNGICVGFANGSWSTATFVGNGNSGGWQATGDLNGIGGTIQGYAWGYVLAMAIDLDAKLVWFRSDRNTNWNNSGANNPATGTGGKAYGTTGALFPAFSGFDDILANQVTLNAGGLPFSLAVPSGFSAWDSAVPSTLGLTGTQPSAFDPANKDSHITLSGSNLTATNTTATNNFYGVKSKNTYGGGSVYFELIVGTYSEPGTLSPIFLGFSQTGASNTVNPGQTFLSSALQIGTSIHTGFTAAYVNGLSVLSGNTWDSAVNDVIGFAVNFNKGLWWAKNITQATNWNANAGANPATGVGGWAIQVPADYAYVHLAQNALNGTIVDTVRFKAPYSGAIPSGFTAWQLASNGGGQTGVMIIGGAIAHAGLAVRDNHILNRRKFFDIGSWRP